MWNNLRVRGCCCCTAQKSFRPKRTFILLQRSAAVLLALPSFSCLYGSIHNWDFLAKIIVSWMKCQDDFFCFDLKIDLELFRIILTSVFCLWPLFFFDLFSIWPHNVKVWFDLKLEVILCLKSYFWPLIWPQFWPHTYNSISDLELYNLRMSLLMKILTSITNLTSKTLMTSFIIWPHE